MTDHIYIARPDEFGWLINEIEKLFHKGNIVAYSILSMSLPDVVEIESEKETDEDPVPHTEAMTVAEPTICREGNKLLLPPDKQVVIESGDQLYITDVVIMIEKKESQTHAPGVIYCFEHKPTAAEYLGSAYFNSDSQK